MAYTVTQHAAAVRAARSLRLLVTVDTGHGSGCVLSVRPDSPGVLGLGVVDVHGETVALGLDVDEAAELRNALTDWLEGQDR